MLDAELWHDPLSSPKSAISPMTIKTVPHISESLIESMTRLGHVKEEQESFAEISIDSFIKKE